MNRERRNELNKAVGLINSARASIEEAKDIIDNCQSEEQDAFDNLPESMQEGDRGDAMQDNIDTMDEALSELDDVVSTLEEQSNNLQDMIER